MKILQYSSLLLLGGAFAFLSGCAQNDTPQEPQSTTQKVEKGAETAAKFAVGHVVGTPAKVAMAATTVAGKVANKVEEKVEGTPAPAATPVPIN